MSTDKFTELTRDVDWQRASFLRYCLNITMSDTSIQGYEDVIVKKIMGGYFVLAMLFYKQFRKDLKEKYDALPNYAPSNEFDVKILMQSALNRLVDEWNHVYAIIVAIRAREANKISKRLVSQMSPFVDVAIKDTVLKGFPVILQYGQAYSLRFSNYSDSFAALSIPLWVLESPWEWTILWHELAGEKVRQLKLQTPEFFTSRFDEIVESLQNEQSQMLEAGWSVDWLEELFEDSFSVIHFPIHFLIVFRNLLDRFPDGGAGQRHPPCSVRLAVALCLHLQMKNAHPDSTELPVVSDWSAWDAWKALYDEGDDNEQKFRENLEDQLRKNSSLDFKVAWLMAGKIRRWHHDNNTDTNDANGFRGVISNAIKRYSNFGYGEDNRDNILKDTIAKILAVPIPALAQQKLKDDGEYTLISKAVTEKLSHLSLNAIGKMLDAHPQVKTLLKLQLIPKQSGKPAHYWSPLGYRELLDLSFYDEDFGLEKIEQYTFMVNTTTYHIASDKLKEAKKPSIKKIQEIDPKTTGWFKIIIKSGNQTIGDFWTSNDSLEHMKKPEIKWIS